MDKKILNSFKEIFGSRVKQNVPFAPMTTFGVGGEAKLYINADSPEDIAIAVKESNALGVRFFLLGGGSKLLVADEGYDGLVIKNGLAAPPKISGRQITIETGHKLGTLVDLAIQNGFAGMEYLAGIPGTVGGAIKGNAGAYGRGTGDHLVSATLVNDCGEVITVEKDYFEFDYRHSNIAKTGDIIVEATFEFDQASPEALRKTADDILAERCNKHPEWGVKCAGSFFKNLPPEEPGGKRIAAAIYLDKAGARGMAVNGAAVWEGHANFVINTGKATAKDIRELAQKLKKLVKAKFGIELAEEVIFVS
jgi:UDP-N-acetylmuramate dehydrogenase